MRVSIFFNSVINRLNFKKLVKVRLMDQFPMKEFKKIDDMGDRRRKRKKELNRIVHIETHIYTRRKFTIRTHIVHP